MMKKLAALAVMMGFAIGLAACNTIANLNNWALVDIGVLI